MILFRNYRDIIQSTQRMGNSRSFQAQSMHDMGEGTVFNWLPDNWRT